MQFALEFRLAPRQVPVVRRAPGTHFTDFYLDGAHKVPTAEVSTRDGHGYNNTVVGTDVSVPEDYARPTGFMGCLFKFEGENPIFCSDFWCL